MFRGSRFISLLRMGPLDVGSRASFLFLNFTPVFLLFYILYPEQPYDN